MEEPTSEPEDSEVLIEAPKPKKDTKSKKKQKELRKLEKSEESDHQEKTQKHNFDFELKEFEKRLDQCHSRAEKLKVNLTPEWINKLKF